MIEIWRSLESEGEKTLGLEEMRLMPVKMADDLDRQVGGHWIYDEETAKANFDCSVQYFGTDGRVSLNQWVASFGPFYR